MATHPSCLIVNSSPRIFLKYYFVVCVCPCAHPCMSLCVLHEYRNPQKPEEGVGFSALDGCKPPVGAENETWVFCKSSKWSQPLSLLSVLVASSLNLVPWLGRFPCGSLH